jgi:integrase
LTARIDGKEKMFSPVYVEKVIRSAYRFLKWLNTHRKGYAEVNQAFLDTLKPPRMTIEYREHEAVTIEEIRAIVKAPAVTVGERRIRASAVFWFLSGIRIGAFCSLPLSAVDLDNLAVKQWPKLGVRTKFKKHATTYLLPIPDLLEVVRGWDKDIRTICGKDGLWFAQISDVGKIIPGAVNAGNHRASIATRDLKNWLKRVGLPYHSPHKFRHGNAVYSIKLAKDIADLKAVSQNLMHSNLSITDGVYGVRSETDIRGRILELVTGLPVYRNDNEIFELLEILLDQRKKSFPK